MNEWQLQDILTKSWIEVPPIFNGRTFHLVAWELMFPSWKINENKKKWNEKSVDFILFDGISTFLCLELKNEIKGRQALLSAYCQAMHRTHLFKTQYRPSLMKSAHDACFDENNSYRIQKIDLNNQDLNFPEEANFQCVLTAVKFPENVTELIAEWRQMTDEEFFGLVSQYKMNKKNREMYLFAEMHKIISNFSIIPVLVAQ